MSPLVDLIEKRLASLELPEPAQYSLLAGGKRLRPLLVLDTTDKLGGDATWALDSAVALELIHTYSLIHDDLPCMDDDDTRRGRPSCHRAFSEWEAVLAGDTLLTHAFDLVANCSLSDSKKIEVIKILSHRSGHNGMIGGQRLDLSHSPDIKTTYRLKTGALFAAAFEIAGVVAGVPTPDLAELGLTYGLVFQLRDDIDDGDGRDDGTLHLKEIEARLDTLKAKCHLHDALFF